MTAIGLTFVFAITVRTLGPLDRGPVIGGYIGLLLMGGAYVSIGVMGSAFTRNSIVAFIASFGICFALYLLGRLVQFVPQCLQPLVAFLDRRPLREHRPRGHRLAGRHLLPVHDRRCLLLATTSLESRRWK